MSFDGRVVGAGRVAGAGVVLEKVSSDGAALIGSFPVREFSRMILPLVLAGAGDNGRFASSWGYFVLDRASGTGREAAVA